jgi:hypothetical protein
MCWGSGLLCGKAGFTERGLKFHTARIHKGETTKAPTSA